MKRINVVVVLFLMLGWSGCRENSGTVDIVTVDRFPKIIRKRNWCFRILWMWNTFRWKRMMNSLRRVM